MPVAVRNMTRNTVVFSNPSRKDSIEWSPTGAADGGDIQRVPEALTEETYFLRAVAKGILKIEDDDTSVRSSIEAQAAVFASQAKEEAKALEDLLEGPANGKDIVISEDDMNTHIARLAKSEPSDVPTEFPEA